VERIDSKRRKRKKRKKENKKGRKKEKKNRVKAGRTLPARMRNNRHPPLNQLAKRQERRLDGPLHRADDDQAHVKVLGYPRDEVLPQLCALFAAKLRQLGVVDAVVLWEVLVKDGNPESGEGDLLSTLCSACAWRTRMIVGGILRSSRANNCWYLSFVGKVVVLSRKLWLRIAADSLCPVLPMLFESRLRAPEMSKHSSGDHFVKGRVRVRHVIQPEGRLLASPIKLNKNKNILMSFL
jgi:hypothetical protein